MKKLSEIIKTDCYIDCGTNEKLREVYPLIGLEEYQTQISMGIYNKDTLILIKHTLELKATGERQIIAFNLPTHHISEIDLNN